ncbi:hypothetical protein SUGI_0848920 [Cryptomeria japonica]|nr:hypothetical protein SUGI_0848920 [Cryptomeria japonica]
MRANYVSSVLVNKIFIQIFAFINVQLFNRNGEYVKEGLADLELWCCEAIEEYVGSTWDKLMHIRQAVGFLVLGIHQLYRINTMYWDDKYGTHSLSQDVIANMRVLMTKDSNSSLGNSFLLDDESR